MKFKLFEADNNPTLQQVEDTVYHGDDGKFYYSPDGIHSEEVPSNLLPTIQKQYNNWLAYQKQKEDPDFDAEQAEQEEKERLERVHNSNKSSDTLNGIKSEYRNATRGEKFRIEKKKEKKKSRYAGALVNPSFNEIAQTVINMANTITEPKYDIERENDWVWDYGNPDPMEEIDDTIRMPAWQYDPVDVEVERESEKPFVLFYFDCSGSCCGSAFIGLGKKLINLMKQLEQQDKIICKDYYFDDTIHDKFFHGGGTSGEAVVNHIKKLTENGKKTANVIIFTDDGCDDCRSSVELDGNALFVFLDTPGRDIVDHVKGKIGNKIVYYTSSGEIK